MLMTRSSAVSIGSNVLGAAGAGLLLVSQVLYIAITTPRLPSPENSGHDFDEEGLIAYYKDEEGEADSNAKNAPAFRLVLLGDSPVEGIGNDYHAEALGGQTALEFSKLLKRPVRYWSYGKTGLTAQGVKEEMLPHLKILSKKCGVDAVVVSCGVNNTLGGYSPQTFGREVRELLCSIRLSCPATRKLMMELLDFELLPFIPYPLSKIASWRSRGLRKEMESIVNDFKNKDQCGGTEMAYMPRIAENLGRRDECSLLNHLSHEERHALTLADFFADDNFHPANIGNTIVGKILAETYSNLINK